MTPRLTRASWPLAAVLAAGFLVACAPARRARRAAADDAWVATRPEAPRALPAKPLEPLPFDHCSASEQGFDRWLEGFRRHALGEGISAATLATTIATLAYDPAVIALDRAQKPFKLSFEAFAAKRLGAVRIARGRRALAKHRELLARIVQRFGVQPEILVAIWGLETDYGREQRDDARALGARHAGVRLSESRALPR